MLISALLGCTREVDTTLPVPLATPTAATSASPLEIEEVLRPDKAGTKPRFAEVIDEKIKATGIGRLRNSVIGKDDIELSVWNGFGLTTLEGYVLKREKGAWSGRRLYEDYVRGEFVVRIVSVETPHIGWEALWVALKTRRVLSLPDAELIKCNGKMQDGFTIVVEIRKGQDYRTYAYENADGVCPEASDVSAIFDSIKAAFEPCSRE